MLLNRFPIILIMAAFLPYLSLSVGLKFEDVIIYPLAALFLLIALASKKIQVNMSVLGLFAVWISILIYMVTRTLIFGGHTSVYSFLADLNNLMQPAAILLLFLIILNSKTIQEVTDLIEKTGKVLLALLVLNSIWILVGFFIDTTHINAYFWGGTEGTALKAATNNRFSGIFNQPLEAGMAYATGLLVWLYLLDKRKIRVGLKSTVVLLLLFIGGAVTVSKIFVLLGVAVFLFFALLSKVARWRLVPIFLMFIAIGYPALRYLTQSWGGMNYLLRLFDIAHLRREGFIHVVTAGRYGSESSQQSEFFQRVWENAPLIGEGMGSQAVYDSAHFYFFSIGGLFGLLGYVALLLTFMWMSIRMFEKTGNSSEARLFLSIVILLIAGGLGAPSFTLNRSSTIMWVFIGLLMQYLCAVRMLKAGRVEEKPVVEPKKKRKRKRFKRYRIVW